MPSPLAYAQLELHVQALARELTEGKQKEKHTLQHRLEELRLIFNKAGAGAGRAGQPSPPQVPFPVYLLDTLDRPALEILCVSLHRDDVRAAEFKLGRSRHLLYSAARHLDLRLSTIAFLFDPAFLFSKTILRAVPKIIQHLHDATVRKLSLRYHGALSAKGNKALKQQGKTCAFRDVISAWDSDIPFEYLWPHHRKPDRSGLQQQQVSHPEEKTSLESEVPDDSESDEREPNSLDTVYSEMGGRGGGRPVGHHQSSAEYSRLGQQQTHGELSCLQHSFLPPFANHALGPGGSTLFPLEQSYEPREQWDPNGAIPSNRAIHTRPPTTSQHVQQSASFMAPMASHAANPAHFPGVPISNLLQDVPPPPEEELADDSDPPRFSDTSTTFHSQVAAELAVKTAKVEALDKQQIALEAHWRRLGDQASVFLQPFPEIFNLKGAAYATMETPGTLVELTREVIALLRKEKERLELTVRRTKEGMHKELEKFHAQAMCRADQDRQRPCSTTSAKAALDEIEKSSSERERIINNARNELRSTDIKQEAVNSAIASLNDISRQVKETDVDLQNLGSEWKKASAARDRLSNLEQALSAVNQTW